MDSKHTPGPWIEAPLFQNKIDILHSDKHTPGAASLTIARVTVRPTWLDQQSANARLIAAAPRMYDFIEQLCAQGDEKALQILVGIHPNYSKSSNSSQASGQAQEAVADLVHAMFRSGNEIPVERITITRAQYEAAMKGEEQ